MKEEIWKDIPGYEGRYQVSSLGRVKSFNYYGHKGVEKILKQNLNKGYYSIKLCKNDVIKRFTIHRLVYMTFKGEIPNGLQVNHIDEDKSNNHIENLNLMSPKENTNWGTRNERARKANTNGKCSKIILQFDKQMNFIAEWPSTREIQRQLNIFHNSIIKCCKGKLKSAYGFIWKYKEE